MENQFDKNSINLDLDDLLPGLSISPGKNSFLVFKDNKYINVHTKHVAFFSVKYESSVLMCFDKEEYFVKYSLDQIQELLPGKQFFRVNRQYLINFQTVKDVERCRSRKLLINPVIPIKDTLLVPKRKISEFLNWLDDR